MAMQYLLLFPYGEDGFSLGILKRLWGSTHESENSTLMMREYYAFFIQQRLNEGNTLISDGRLFQQYIVDAYCCIEGIRLRWIQKKRKKKKKKRLIEEALAYGDFIATYIHGVMLLCESNPNGIGNLLEVLNDEHGKHKLLKCWKIFWLLATGTALFQSPNFQACQKTGMGNWNWNEPYPYGYEEFVVMCRRCLIDLEMFKLVNRLF